MEFPTSRSMRMMTSVSTLVRMIGAAIAESSVKGFGMSALHRSHVGDGAQDRRSRSAGRTRQMSTGARSLPSDEVAIGSRNRPLAGRHDFAVGRKTHRTAGLTPLETCFGEDLVEALGDGVALDRLRARHHPGT